METPVDGSWGEGLEVMAFKATFNNISVIL
jgi:hypothetical protein